MGPLGAWLSSADLEGVAVLLEDFTCRGLVPHLERRLRELNFQVVARGSRPSALALLHDVLYQV